MSRSQLLRPVKLLKMDRWDLESGCLLRAPLVLLRAPLVLLRAPLVLKNTAQKFLIHKTFW